MLLSAPGVNYVPLSGSEVCCGGAGIYNLLEPELSSQVLREKLTSIENSGARVVATGNPGCHMQIRAGSITANKLELRVFHPVEILDESYRCAGLYAKSGF
jgi:glycolate oxidase iron-sulfur subunit